MDQRYAPGKLLYELIHLSGIIRARPLAFWKSGFKGGWSPLCLAASRKKQHKAKLKCFEVYLLINKVEEMAKLKTFEVCLMINNVKRFVSILEFCIRIICMHTNSQIICGISLCDLPSVVLCIVETLFHNAKGM
ncbi:hypothetical protein CEXT_504131 [Caerostris extrusa]|uniref:Uncharacterized protein n=1 Tax=Caerostris extrusa TaxID=172846 RepID=A0AAV4P1N4_CAEEX|nr:hypothetical protein CEXT_504131 [Caerostris extrusa]